MSNPKSDRRRRLSLLLAATLGGGTLFGACDTRFRTGIVEGSKGYFLNEFLPGLFEDIIPVDEPQGGG